MGVKDDGDAEFAFEFLDEIVCDFRRHDAGHVFDTDRVAAHFFEFDAHANKSFDGVDGAGGVADFAACMFFAIDHRFDGGSEVAGVVEGIEDAEDVLSGGGIDTDEGLDDVIGETRVLHDVLATQQHDLWRFGCGFFEYAEAVERVFVEVAQTGIDGGAAPSFEAAETEFIEDGGRRQHLLGGHAGGRKGLVTVAENGVVEGDRFHGIGGSR